MWRDPYCLFLFMSERKCRIEAADDKWKCNPCYTVAIHIENKTGFRYHEGKERDWEE